MHVATIKVTFLCVKNRAFRRILTFTAPNWCTYSTPIHKIRDSIREARPWFGI
jgi:hypothetical protein